MNKVLKKVSALFLIILMISSISFNVVSYCYESYIMTDDDELDTMPEDNESNTMLDDDDELDTMPDDKEKLEGTQTIPSNNAYNLMITNRNNNNQAYTADEVAKNINTGDSSDYDVLLTQDASGQYYYCMEKGGALMLYANGGSTLREFYYKSSSYNLTAEQKIVLAYLNSEELTTIGGISLDTNNNREKIIQYYIWKSGINEGYSTTVPSVYANIISSLQKCVNGKIKIGNDILDINAKILTINGSQYEIEEFSAYKYISKLVYRRDNGKGYIESNYQGCGQEIFGFTSNLVNIDLPNEPEKPDEPNEPDIPTPPPFIPDWPVIPTPPEEEKYQAYPLLMYIKGTAFLDGVEGKESKLDGYYNPENNSDKGLEGIKVEIYDEATNNLAIFATREVLTSTNNNMICDTRDVDFNALEKYGKATTYTDKDGNFKFYGLNPSHTYYIIFTYNGMRYAEIKATTETGIDATNYNIKLPNASKAIELDRKDKITDIFSEIGTYPYNYYSTSKGGYNIGYNQDDVEEAIKNGLSKCGNNYEMLYNNLSQYMDLSLAHFIKDCQVTAKISGLGNIFTEAEQQLRGYNSNGYIYPVVEIVQYYNTNQTQIKEGYTSQTIANIQWAMFNIKNQPYLSASYQDVYNRLKENLKTLNEDINRNLTCANLGVQYRSTFDMALYNDVQKADVTINGVPGEYVYDKRAANGQAFSFGVNEYDLKTYYKNLSDGNVQALRDLKYNTTINSTDEYMNYLRSSDIHYLSTIEKTNTGIAQAGGYEDKNNSIYLTYKIRLINQSSVEGTVTEIVDYYNSDFEVAKVYGENNKQYQYSTESIYNSRGIKKNAPNGYSALYIRLDNTNLKNNESQYIYIVLKMKDIEKTLTSEVLNNGYKVINLAEINGYKTANGYIDIDSMAGNIVETNRFENGKYEDDESKSPTLIFKNPSEEGRTISGIVFEDATSGEWVINGSRQQTANNQYDEKDILIQGATVQLIQILDNGTEKLSAQTDTTKDGTYKFIHIRPGNYVVRFAYGNSDKTALTSKNKIDDENNALNIQNEKSYNGESYENTEKKVNTTLGANGYWYTDSDIDTNARYSDAKDDEGRRKTVTENFATLKNENAEILNAYKDTKVNRSLVTKLKELSYMYATTDNMKLEMEYVGSKNQNTNGTTTTANGDGKYTYDYNITNLDFGIVERSRAKLDVIKQVSYISLVSSAGEEITGGTYDDWKNNKIKYIKWILGEDGFVDMEIDTELLSGATLKITYDITVKDNSEAGNEITDIEVVDYVTNNLNYSTDYKNNEEKSNSVYGWNTITTENLLKNKYVNNTSANSSDEANRIDLSVYQTILTATFKPGETKRLTLEKNLSPEDDSDFNYDNRVEIISSKNSKGRGDYFSIYGNLDPITYTSRQGNLYWDFIKGITSSADNDTESITENNGFNAIRIAEGDSASAEEVIVTPPQGAKSIVIQKEYYIFGITLALSLLIGTVLIKKYRQLD